MGSVLAQEEQSLFDNLDEDLEPGEISEALLYEEQAKAALASQAVPRTYYLEYIFIAFLVVYAVNFFVGKRINERLAVHWLSAIKPIFELNFSHLGVSDKPDGPSMQFFASGRYNCGYAIVSFELRKRQDIISDFFLRLVWPDKDKLTIEIPIKPNSDLPAVFSIVKKQQVKTVRKYFEDLVDNLVSTHAVLAENDEVPSEILDQKVCNNLQALGSYLDMMYLTDQNPTNPNYPLTLRMHFYLPTNFKEIDAVSRMAKTTIFIVDNITNIKLSPAAKQAAEKERKIRGELSSKQKQPEREEELQMKKQQKKEEEKKNLSKEQQKRLEQKEQKKKMKQSQPRFKMVKG